MQRRATGRGGRDGQALIEFMSVAVVLVVMVTVLALFLYTFREYGGRVLNLVASEYP